MTGRDSESRLHSRREAVGDPGACVAGIVHIWAERVGVIDDALQAGSMLDGAGAVIREARRRGTRWVLTSSPSPTYPLEFLTRRSAESCVVDVVPAASLKPGVAARAFAEAIPL